MPPSQKAADQFYDNYTVSARLGADLTDTLAVNSVLRYTDSTLLFNSDLSGACFCLADALRSEQDDRQFHTRDEVVWHSLDNRFRRRVRGYLDVRRRASGGLHATFDFYRSAPDV